MANSVSSTCPACAQKQVKSRFSWRAILYAIFCFPCGFYCCLKRRSYYCAGCHCDVVRANETIPITKSPKLGYNYRLYEATETGLPASYRNEAATVRSINSVSSEQSTTSSTAHIIYKM